MGGGGTFWPQKSNNQYKGPFLGPGNRKSIRWGDFLGPSKVIINIRALLSPPTPPPPPYLVRLLTPLPAGPADRPAQPAPPLTQEILIPWTGVPRPPTPIKINPEAASDLGGGLIWVGGFNLGREVAPAQKVQKSARVGV